MERYKIIKIITYWKQSSQSNEKVGWLLHDFKDQKDYGYTFEEAWQLIHEFVAVNTTATIRKTKSLEVKELVPSALQPGFLDTSWQIKFDETKNVTYSPACLKNINCLIFNDEKRKIENQTAHYLRSKKELISTWRKYENIMKCIELAHQIQNAKHLVIYVGASIWQEAGLHNIYASDVFADPDHLENLFVQSIETKFFILNIIFSGNYFKLIDIPYVFEFLKMVKRLNAHSEFLFEVEEGIFQKGKQSSPIDLVLSIGAEIPNEMQNHACYIGYERCEDTSKYNMMLHAPITEALKEVESHFVIKGRMICNVCGDNVAHGIGSSGIAPVTVAICYSCGSKGAEPYGILTARVAELMYRRPDYTLSPKLQMVKRATLSITGISEEKFWEDVREKIKDIKRKRMLD